MTVLRYPSRVHGGPPRAMPTAHLAHAPEPLAGFTAAHPPPWHARIPAPAVQGTNRGMGRIGLPHAWAQVRGHLEDERGGQSAAAGFHRDGTTFVVVHDSRRAPLDPAGMRTLYS